MIIFNKRTRNQILKKILEKEFERKYNWKIIQKNKEFELIPFTDLQKFIIYFENNLVSIECEFLYLKKKEKYIYLTEVLKKIYKYYLKSIILEYFIKNYQQSIKSLYFQSFINLSTYDLKITRQII